MALFLSLLPVASAQILSITIGTYDTTVSKTAQFAVPVTVNLQNGNGTVSVTISPKSGLSCDTCTNTLDFSTSGSQSTTFTLTADAAGTYTRPFTITASLAGATPATSTATSTVVVTEPPVVYDLILYNTSAPVKNASDGKYYVPLVLEFTTGSVALENVTIKLDLTGALGKAIVSSGVDSYYFSSLPANSPVKVNWIARFDSFSVYGISGAVIANNYYSPVAHSQSGPETTTGTPATGGGGGGGGVSAIVEGLQELTASLFTSVLKELGLISKQFYSLAANSLASILAITGESTGEYPAPSNATVQSTLTKPVQALQGDVYELAAKQVRKKWAYANTIVIARGDLEVDSLAAIAYAKAKGIPILLVKPDELPQATLAVMKQLTPNKIIIAGGPVAVSQAVEDELKKVAPTERIWGNTRVETAIELAKNLERTEAIKTIVITDGRNANTDVALLAAAYRAPVVYTAGTTLPEVTRDFLAAHKMAAGAKTRVIFVGVSSEAKQEIEAAMK